jgi:hypothetical protein
MPYGCSTGSCVNSTPLASSASYVEADVGDAAIRRTEEEHRALDAPALQVAVRRLAERRAKAADEMRL